MAEFTGQSLKVSWIHPGGTVDLSGDYRTVSYQPVVGLVKSTAGSDAFEAYLTTVKETTISYTGVMQTGGTATEDALLPGVFGTVIIQPEGTATGKRKYTVPAFSQGAKFDWKYADTVEISTSWQSSGTPTIGVN